MLHLLLINPETHFLFTAALKRAIFSQNPLFSPVMNTGDMKWALTSVSVAHCLLTPSLRLE